VCVVAEVERELVAEVVDIASDVVEGVKVLLDEEASMQLPGAKAAAPCVKDAMNGAAKLLATG
jgi:hypothetical protein